MSHEFDTTSTNQNCAACTREDEYEDMVECEQCNQWRHYSCASIKPPKEGPVAFICPKCQMNNLTERMDKLAVTFGSVGEGLQQLIGALSSTKEGSKSKDDNQRTNDELISSEVDKVSLDKDDNQMSDLPVCHKELKLDEKSCTTYKTSSNIEEGNEYNTFGEGISRVDGTLNKSVTSRKKQSITNFPSSNIAKTTDSKSKIFDVKYDVADGSNLHLEARNLNQNSPIERLLTRQSLQELPAFDGNPLDWPKFKTIYEQTTIAGCYSKIENLVRLEKALKGEALNMTRALFFDPNNIEEVMRTLQFHYGQPHRVINALTKELLKMKAPKEGTINNLVLFAQKLRNLVCSIKSVNMHQYLYQPMLIKEITEKLSLPLQYKWGEYYLRTPDATIEQLAEWLHEQASISSLIAKDITKKEFINTHVENKQYNCKLCKQESHKLSECSLFNEMKVNKRWKHVKANNLCLSCLGRRNHRISDCKTYKRCNIDGCNYYHHKLLHEKESLSRLSTSQIASSSSSNEEHEVIGLNHSNRSKVIFKIIPVTLYNKNIRRDIYAYLDDGSSTTLIDSDLVQQLKIEGSSDPICLKWTNNMSNFDESSLRCSVRISGINSSKRFVLNDVRTISNLSLPTQTLDFNSLKSKYTHLDGVKFKSYQNAKPLMLIGLKHANLITSTEIRMGKFHEPVAAKTRLGWSIYGPQNNDSLESYCLCICECSQDSNEALKDLERQSTKNIFEQNKQALKIIDNTLKYKNNRYEVGLLWKESDIYLPNSYPTAMKRLVCLENKLKKQPDTAKWYSDTINDYLAKGYLRKATDDDLKVKLNKTWYLPHFCICNYNKIPPKRRLVFDAAAETNGVSLNSQLLSGPNLVPQLTNILHNFRRKAIGVTADIKEMFHQISIIKDDQQSQRILWRECHQNRKPDIYIMQVMTFGSTCSPVCAAAIKNKNAERYKEEYPEAVSAITDCHYVDDLIISFDTDEGAVAVCSQVVKIHKAAGFELRGFQSNNHDVLKHFQTEYNKSGAIEFDKQSDVNKTLGLYWDTYSDEFFFKISLFNLPDEVIQNVRNITKREALSFVMRIYDPLGLIGLMTIRGRVIIQEIWRNKFEWDEPVSDELNQKFFKWTQELNEINKIRIPRYHFKSIDNNVELHIMVDASDKAYCAVAYFRITNPEAKLSLVGSKTKVVSNERLTTPQKELIAAVIGVRFSQSIIEAYQNLKISKYFWTDSTVTIARIKNSKKEQDRFVKVRIQEILEGSNIDEWNHVLSGQNIADDGTKNNGSISSESRWFSGSENLSFPNIQVQQSVVATVFDIDVSFEFISVENFSSWIRLRNTVAYILRFIKIKLYKQQPLHPHLDLKELEEAEQLLFKKAQYEEYPEEYLNMINGYEISSKCKMYRLSPIIDNHGVIRLNGRLNKSFLHPETKQPIILPKNHYITRLIVKHYHEKFLHHNQEAIIASIRKKFWISNIRSIVNSVKSRCQVCRNNTAKPVVPMMGQLPDYKFAVYRKPFTYTGVDLFGPFEVQVTKRITEKRYGTIFVCMTSGAVHIELVSDLSADAFIRVLRNMINRRGPVLKFISDNGTNFHAAVKEINTSICELGEAATELEVQWDFIPPRSPNFGGQWERLIRSIKIVLQHLLKSSKPKEDILRSSLIEAENIVNSRPLTHVPVDPDGTEPITPNDIIKGAPHPALAPGVFGEHEYKYGRHWRIAQQFANSFWKRWIDNYLPELVKRPKWCSPAKPMEIGDVVIIIDANGPRSLYRKGVVVKLYPGSDKIIRVAKVKTQSGELKRPVSKLAVLDVRN